MSQLTPLFSLPFRSLAEVAFIQLRTQAAAKSLGLALDEQVKLSIAVSTFAGPIIKAACHGQVAWHIQSNGTQQLLITVETSGGDRRDASGVKLDEDRIQTLRLKGVVDAIEYDDVNGSKRVTLRKNLHAAPIGAEELNRIGAALQSNEAELLEELEQRDLAVLGTLEEAQARLQQVEYMHSELTETNRGVVALYDELDTLHRVGRVVASQLDLDSLVTAITDATTDISAAELGAYFFQDGEAERFTCHSTAGPLARKLELGTQLTAAEVYQGALPEGDVLRLDDAPKPEPGHFWPPMHLRSYLVVGVRDVDGNPAGVLVFGHREPGAFTERTERILSSVALQLSIGLQNAQLYRNVQAASAAKDQFLAMLSHELRTPLNPVFVVLASLEEQPSLSEEVRRDLQLIRRNLQLEARLIDDLLDLTRIVRGKITLHKEPVDLHSLLPAVRDICQDQIRAGKVQVTLQLHAQGSLVQGDSARLQQVFWNLLSNAVKFSPEGAVTITTRQDGEQIVVQVKDTGRGISEETLGKIFRPFEQGEPGVTASFGGLGLGLTISKNIIDGHGGTISARSGGLGSGALFEVRLQLAPNQPLTTAKEAPPRVTLPGATAPTPARLLLVEDHLDTVQTMQRLLIRRGYQVKTATSCREALTVAERNEFDLVISDIGLPDRSGLDLMRELAATYGLKGIALSGYGMDADIERSKSAGFVAHLTKPLDLGTLDRLIRETLG